ncbi:MAG: hypothetical protein EZS28_028600 [Streblomastix strix]|uniref:Uncharacterized protein n=1 Tax=Streblomastix strix TaxID=222440 RepID=A0A5J4V052_9EUKA|nr:MAG: hypothetical protein EZS28_028600 [Streblomastix strix]
MKQGKSWEDLMTVKDPEEKEINGFVLKQMMKKPQYATRKKRKEESKYKLDILLRYIQGKFGYIDQLGEQEHIGCMISSIIAFATLHLTEINRTKATRNEDGSLQLETAVWMGDDYDLTVTFRPKKASYEYLSKAVHKIMKGAGVQAKNSVTQILKSSITKSIDQDVSQQDVDRSSRHKEGAGTIAVHQDINLNDRLSDTDKL